MIPFYELAATAPMNLVGAVDSWRGPEKAHGTKPVPWLPATRYLNTKVAAFSTSLPISAPRMTSATSRASPLFAADESFDLSYDGWRKTRLGRKTSNVMKARRAANPTQGQIPIRDPWRIMDKPRAGSKLIRRTTRNFSQPGRLVIAFLRPSLRRSNIDLILPYTTHLSGSSSP
jgi:hypothetical protein